MVVDLGVLLYFIHHIATMIQLPQVIASIARELSEAIDEQTRAAGSETGVQRGLSPAELAHRLQVAGGTVTAPASGYLQYIRHDTLVDIAAELDAVIQLHYRPGHFLTQGHRLASVWPAGAAAQVGRRLRRAHVSGPNRTLTQDLAFAIDQLVEIAIRALSTAVNDTFTALTCIDWLGDSISTAAAR